jgi:tRNA-2-methylthio-N6-dimethylallyladenosine synthase
MEMRAYIETWGCQMNLRQSEGIGGILADAGYRLVSSLDQADVVIFNGCMVRQKAEEKLFGRIGAVVQQKRSRRVLLGIGGCLGQIHGESLLQRISAVDFVFGSGGHASLPALIERARGQRTAELAEPSFGSDLPERRESRISAMVTITEGCSNYCTYCIVPFARGAMRSRPRDLILREIEDLIERGYREVLLLGQNVNAYGTDRRDFGDFSDLLHAVAETGMPRVRFTTSHPKDMSERILRTMAHEPNVCPHLHLACQSGSDGVLKAMNRRYTSAEFVHIAQRARDIVPHLNLSTDLIVGFPGETERDFDATMDLLERVRFGTVYAAKYSPRPLTQAKNLPDDVPSEVKERRLARVLERQRSIALEENGRFVGGEIEVLIEGKTRAGALFGRAADHRTVVCEGVAEPGDLVMVHVDGASASSLSGSILVCERLGGLT